MTIYKGKKLYSFVDNHDVDRLASKLNVKENMIPIYALLYFLPGIPSIYYGSEFGIEGRKEGGNDDPLRPALNLRKIRRQKNFRHGSKHYQTSEKNILQHEREDTANSC